MMSKAAIITGASRGIGYQLCRALAKENTKVIAVARSQKPLEKLEQEYPGHITAQPTDLTNEQSVKQLVDSVNQTFDGVDILVNNAGSLINKPFSELTLDNWRSQMEINVISAVHLTNRLLEHFNDSAHIVNISSMGGYQGSAKFPGLSAYSVSKGALTVLSECLAVELSDKGIKTNALCLGAVQTEMLEEAFPGFDAPVTAKEMGTYIANFALNGATYYNGKILPVALDDPD